MKKETLIFFLWIFFLALTIFKVYLLPKWFLVLMFLFWIFIAYWRIHTENKKARIPKPVYLANPENLD